MRATLSKYVYAAIGLAHRLRQARVSPDEQFGHLRLDIDYSPDGPYLDWGDYEVVVATRDLRFDGDGLPRILRAGDWRESPVTITQYGLQEDARARRTDADPSHAGHATAVAEWLVSNQDPATGKWLYGFPFEVGGMDVTLPSPWASAMAQGQAMSLLTRVHSRTGDQRYLDAAVRGLDSLKVDVADGGLTSRWNGHPVYEEFPTTPSSFALNGWLFALVGLYDLAEADERPDARTLLEAGMTSLEALLPLYDTGRVSAYHLGHLTKPPRGVHRSLYYHYIHIQLLSALERVAAGPNVAAYRDLWRRYRPRRLDPR